MNFTLKVFKNGKSIDQVRTHSIRLFLKHLRTINWEQGGIKTYIRVSYGKKTCVRGCVCTFYNDGFYETKDDLQLAFAAFYDDFKNDY